MSSQTITEQSVRTLRKQTIHLVDVTTNIADKIKGHAYVIEATELHIQYKTITQMKLMLNYTKQLKVCLTKKNDTLSP